MRSSILVMAGLVPAISLRRAMRPFGMAGTSPAMTNFFYFRPSHSNTPLAATTPVANDACNK
jgi:hypothetical protein